MKLQQGKSSGNQQVWGMEGNSEVVQRAWALESGRAGSSSVSVVAGGSGTSWIIEPVMILPNHGLRS